MAKPVLLTVDDDREVLRAVEKALRKDPEANMDLVGLMVWTLDYFPGRSPLPAERQVALRLREAVLAQLSKQ